MPAGLRQDQVFYRKYLYNLILIYKNRDDVKMFLEILLSLITVAVFAIFAIKPTFVTIAGLLTEIQSKQETIAIMDQKIQNISAAQQTFEQQREAIVLLQTAVPSKPDPDIYIKQVEGFINKHSLTLEGLSTQDITLIGDENDQESQAVPLDPDDIPPLPFPQDSKIVDITISASGEYQNLQNFLKEIQDLLRPLLIDSTSFDQTTTFSEEKLILTIIGRIPFVKV